MPLARQVMPNLGYPSTSPEVVIQRQLDAYNAKDHKP